MNPTRRDDSTERTEGRAEPALVAILRLAYSGERAAALAYRGHSRSVPDAEDRRRIGRIEAEELEHRALVGEMLRRLGEAPSGWLEARAWIVGHALGLLCHVVGWLPPMLGAGKLESRNIQEYESAARLAWACGRRDWADCLLEMAETEWDHESYFRSRVLAHAFGRRLRLWPAPPPRNSIRASFERDVDVDLAQAAREDVSILSTIGPTKPGTADELNPPSDRGLLLDRPPALATKAK